MNGKHAFFVILRLIVQIWLFGMFLHFFGKPALERYLDKKVIVVTSRRETGGTPAPALTIVVKRSDTGTAWKKEALRSEFEVRVWYFFLGVRDTDPEPSKSDFESSQSEARIPSVLASDWLKF